jgi:hypothetical protein
VENDLGAVRSGSKEVSGRKCGILFWLADADAMRGCVIKGGVADADGRCGVDRGVSEEEMVEE